MPRSYVTDLTHFLDHAGELVDGPAGKLAGYLGLVVESASMMKAGQGGYIPLRCAQPGRRRRCAVQLTAARVARDCVEWQCQACGDSGSITNWSGTRFDLGPARELSLSDAQLDVIVPLDELDAMRRLGGGPRTLRQSLAEAIGIDDGYLFLPAGQAELTQLKQLSELAADEARGDDRRLLDRFAARMDAFITTLASFVEGDELNPQRMMN
jgi:hypothetical protein